VVEAIDQALKWIGLKATDLSGLDFEKKIALVIRLDGGRYNMNVRVEVNTKEASLTDGQTTQTLIALLAGMLRTLMNTDYGKALIMPLPREQRQPAAFTSGYGSQAARRSRKSDTGFACLMKVEV